MKASFIFLAALFISFTVCSQIVQDPVKWSYKVIKNRNDEYKLIVRAKILKDWHIYAQQQPKDALSTPTKLEFSFPKSIHLLGKPIEKGNKEKQLVEVLDITQYYYKDQVDFVQNIAFTGKGTVKVSCKISYMACNEQMCLPVKDFNFWVYLPIQVPKRESFQ
ncbi:protein-disulfide reductase DsbD domain-containing protein [Pedobacter sp.]|jgi:hypothetical protein|uniref:protein-disulfide reductase DsbD domain-containing protein n=1 Tax=Pedobacter sp. TaxID=1411316 RepID=UPI002B535509|nr:protein-disulfide reductase DsbD domain-containing protein [Pedobacter sp.]HWW37877.1 protein-disulfide reductase DsbD domain-containing protein [Pedobacter sp.]